MRCYVDVSEDGPKFLESLSGLDPYHPSDVERVLAMPHSMERAEGVNIWRTGGQVRAIRLGGAVIGLAVVERSSELGTAAMIALAHLVRTKPELGGKKPRIDERGIWLDV